MLGTSASVYLAPSFVLCKYRTHMYKFPCTLVNNDNTNTTNKILKNKGSNSTHGASAFMP